MNRVAAAILSLLAFAVAGCGNTRNETDPADILDRQVCTGADVGNGYNHQTSGDFSPANLAAISPDNEAGELKKLEQAGLIGGHFAYWKQVAGHPPFDPPLDVVCQVLEFDSETEAAAFAAGTAEDVASAVIALLPARHTVAEVANVGMTPSREFAITGDGDAGPTTMTALVVVSGRYVRSVYAGGLDPTHAAAESERIQQQMATRLR